MPLTNTDLRYGSPAKVFHWSIALLILTLIPLGIVANNLPYGTAEQLAQKAWLFSLHKTLGVTVFFLALARIGWALSQPKPAPLHPDRKAESFLAELVHWLLYGSLVLVPLSGWVHHAATTGFAPIWWPFGQSLPFVPKSDALAETMAGLHIVFERVLALSILLHVAGALKHALIDRDGTLARMWPGRAATTAPAARHGRPWPSILTALAVWGAALGVGSAMGLFAHDSTHDSAHDSRPEAATLEQVASDWQVEQGTLGLTITQFGSAVSGRFDTWTAAIRFEPRDTPGPAGDVSVELAIASLSLGTVSDQAMGPDFFATESHPTARFTADILYMDGGYVAQGTLTLKGAEQPLTLPFDLTLEDGTAQMQGRVTLDRRDFAIGTAMTDPGQLGFEVVLDVSLTATRAE